MVAVPFTSIALIFAHCAFLVRGLQSSVTSSAAGLLSHCLLQFYHRHGHLSPIGIHIQSTQSITRQYPSLLSLMMPGSGWISSHHQPGLDIHHEYHQSGSIRSGVHTIMKGGISGEMSV